MRLGTDEDDNISAVTLPASAAALAADAYVNGAAAMRASGAAILDSPANERRMIVDGAIYENPEDESGMKNAESGGGSGESAPGFGEWTESVAGIRRWRYVADRLAHDIVLDKIAKDAERARSEARSDSAGRKSQHDER